MVSRSSSSSHPGISMTEPNAHTTVILEEQKQPPSPLPMEIIPILLKEATLDTPSFRAHCEHLHAQFQDVDHWLEALLARNQEIDNQLRPLRHAVNDLLDVFMPSFLFNHVVDQSSISLLFRRYAEGVSSHWTSVMFEARKHFAHVASRIRAFHSGPRNVYRTARSRWLQQQKLYDKAVHEYQMLARKHTTPAMYRDASQQVYKYRVRYLKQSLLYCETLVDTKRKLNSCLCDTFAPLFKIDVPTLIPPEKHMAIAHDMHRLSCYGQLNTREFWLESLERVRTEMLRSAKRSAPSKVHTDYMPVPDSWFSQQLGGSREKYGWVYIKVPQNRKHTWARVWAFIKNGTFGWLSISPSGTFVQESPRVSAPLCTLQNTKEDRSFCFRLQTPRFKLVIQCENALDLKSWIGAFGEAKREYLQINPNTNHYFPKWTTDISSSATAALFDLEKHPLVDTSNTELADNISQEIDRCMDVMTAHLSMLDGRPDLDIVPALFHVKPMATARATEAVIASRFLEKAEIPNALVGNFGGSVHWAQLGSKPQPLPSYPRGYPDMLMYHDMDMRSYFSLACECDEDLVVMGVRCSLRMREGSYVQCLLYATGRSIVAIDYSAGFGGVLTLQLSDLLNVHCETGVDFDSVELTHRSGSTFQKLDLRLYVDSGALFRRRIQFLFDNVKSTTPVGLLSIIKAMQQVGQEHAAEVAKLAEAQQPRAQDLEVAVAATADPDLVTEGRLHHKSNHAQIEQHARKMRLRAEGVFHIWPKQMFYLLFGDTSKILSAYLSDGEDPKWYYSGGRVVRDVHLDLRKILWSFKLQNQIVTFTQTIERRDENYFYSVTERSSVFSFYSAEFRVINKYIIALTRQGTKLLVYNSIHWYQHSTVAKSVVDKMVEELCDRRPTFLLEQVQEHLKNLPRKDDNTYDVSEYGKIRISGTRDEQAQPAKSVVTINRLIVRVVFSGLLRALWNLVKRLASWLVKAFTGNFWLLVLAVASLAANFVLLSTSGVSVWRSYWMQRSVEHHADKLQLFPDFHRAIFSRDVEQLVHRDFHVAKGSEASNECWQTFKHLGLGISLRPDADQSTEKLVQHLFDARLEIAVKRNELLAQLRKLEAEEVDLVQLAWKKWVLGEVSRCNHARGLIAMSNQTVLAAELMDYCVPCLEAAKGLI